jgi:hypothetical protein
MNAWIRLTAIDPFAPVAWHLQLGITPSGLRIAACGYSYAPTSPVDVRPAVEVPSMNVCEACDVAYRR